MTAEERLKINELYDYAADNPNEFNTWELGFIENLSELAEDVTLSEERIEKLEELFKRL